MENPLRGAHAGRVTEPQAAVGQTVPRGTVLCGVVPGS